MPICREDAAYRCLRAGDPALKADQSKLVWGQLDSGPAVESLGHEELPLSPLPLTSLLQLLFQVEKYLPQVPPRTLSRSLRLLRPRSASQPQEI